MPWAAGIGVLFIMKAIAPITAIMIIIIMMTLKIAIVAEYCTLWYYTKYLCGKE